MDEVWRRLKTGKESREHMRRGRGREETEERVSVARGSEEEEGQGVERGGEGYKH